MGFVQLQELLANLRNLGTQRLAALGVLGVAVFAIVGLGSYYVSRPDYETLYLGLTRQDVGRMGAALADAGIAFDISADGTKISVQQGSAARARALLAEKGLPGSADAGYELFDKLGPLGLTSFMQEVTRVRALEGELARTIQQLRGVKTARVHLVLPESGSLSRNRQPPSASVVVHSDIAGDTSSTLAIRHLVAAAIPGLGIESVRVLGSDGTVLAGGGDGTGETPRKMIELERSVSKDVQENIRRTLAPYLGLENFEVSATARLNTDKRQTSETAFDPDTRVERSTKLVKESQNSRESGKNGAVTVEQNIPGANAEAGGGDQNKRSNERKEEMTNFEIGSKQTQTTSDGYRVEQVAVAVVVNRTKLLASLGDKPAPDALEKQLAEIEKLASSAAGLDSKRGDKLSVAAVPFVAASEAMDAQSAAGMMQLLVGVTDSLIKSATILAVAFIAIWLGFRPATRALMGLPAPANVLAAEQVPPSLSSPGFPMLGQESTMDGGIDLSKFMGPPVGEPSFAGADFSTTSIDRTPQQRLEQLVDLDSEQAATILRQWVRGG